MNYAEILLKVPDWLQVIALVLMAIVVLATVAVRVAAVVAKMTENTADDEKVAKAQELVNKVAEGLMKFLHLFPTLGKNPRTQQLEKAYQELKKDPPDESQKAG